MRLEGNGELLHRRRRRPAEPRRRLVLPGAEGRGQTDRRVRRLLEGRDGGRLMFALSGARKASAGRTALGPLTLAMPPGRTTVLIGPSGCGKSTLLRLLIGLVEPDAGDITFDGQRVTPATARAVRLRVGYVIQDGGLF